ncbi:MAG: effector-associated domain EAD1-containing protein [Cyanophyceae cyanobacterium]
MASWNNVNRKALRAALQDAYLSYTRLEIFAHDELDASLERIAPSSQDMETVAFKLIEWARAERRLDDLYEAFRRANPRHPFQIGETAKSPVPKASPSVSPTPIPAPPPAVTNPLDQIQIGETAKNPVPKNSPSVSPTPKTAPTPAETTAP